MSVTHSIPALSGLYKCKLSTTTTPAVLCPSCPWPLVKGAPSLSGFTHICGQNQAGCSSVRRLCSCFLQRSVFLPSQPLILGSGFVPSLFIYKYNFFFLAVLGLHCCIRLFSSCGKQGLLSRCSAWALKAQWLFLLWSTGFRARGSLGHVGSVVKKKKKSACQCRRHGFHPRSRKIPHASEHLSPCASYSACALEPGSCNH